MNRLTKIGNGTVVHLVTTQRADDGHVTTFCGYRAPRSNAPRTPTGPVCMNCIMTLGELNQAMTELQLEFETT